MLTKECCVILFGMLLIKLFVYRIWNEFFYIADARQNKFGKTLTTIYVAVTIVININLKIRCDKQHRL